ncbi:Na+/H+ antiporter NhaA [Pseudarthrobacter sp. NPDC058329]|uniref:Na+/H+ antiporter NhaA n=1 Tax=Pseudarthrobacter sp. NPDC058329 TaxID=3346448 RepID=UPI0036D8ADFC
MEPRLRKLLQNAHARIFLLGLGMLPTGATFLITRLPGITKDVSFTWSDVIGMAFVAGVGFTVSLLVGELSYGTDGIIGGHVKVGVLAGSLLAATIGAVILNRRNRYYRPSRGTSASKTRAPPPILCPGTRPGH